MRLWLVGLRNLQRNPRRTSAAVITLALGSASLFLFHGFNAGTVNQYREDTIHSRYGHGQLQTKGYLDQIHEKPWEHWIADAPQVLKSLRSIPNVEHVFPRIEFFALLSSGARTISARGQAIDAPEEARFFSSLNIEQGTALSDQAEGILLGRGIARALGVKPGDNITVLSNTVHGSMNGIDLTVSGVFHTGQKDFDDAYFRIPLEKGFELLDTRLVETIALGLKSMDDWPALAQAVRIGFPSLDATSFAVLDEVYYQHTLDWLDAQFGFIQAIILVIVVLGVLNTVSTAILERKQEIGNLRANGETPWDIGRLLAWEAVFLGILGSLAGIAIAYLLNETLLRSGIPMPPGPGQTRSFNTLIELQWNMALKVFFLGIGGAILGTLAAGIKIIKLPIAEALRAT